MIHRIHHIPLEYVCYGKPNPLVFKNVEAVFRQILLSHCDDHFVNKGDIEVNGFKTLYMIGDNPVVDIKGAREVRLSNACNFINITNSYVVICKLLSEVLIHDFRQEDLGFLF